MPTGFTYTTFSATLAAMMIVDTSNDPDWATFLPSIIDGAELRILRELDPVIARKSGTVTFGVSATAALNALVTPPADFVVMREFGFYTPVGSNAASASPGGTWNDLLEVEAGWARQYNPNRNTTGTPAYFALLDMTNILLVPTPAAGYTAELFYTYRPTPLSSGNATTWIASNVPDLFLYAAAVVASGYLKNYGAQADDPQAPVTWEKLYQRYLAPAQSEEMRRKAEGQSDESSTRAPRSTPTG